MFKEVLDWVSLFAGIFTVLAAITTIFGVIIAYKAWTTWKHQQDYVLARDKVFETQRSFLAIELYLKLVFDDHVNYHAALIRHATESEQMYFEEFKNKINNLNELFSKFEINVLDLHVLGICKNTSFEFSKLYNFNYSVKGKLYRFETTTTDSMIFHDEWGDFVHEPLRVEMVEINKILREIRESI